MEGERKIRVRVWLGYMGFIGLGLLTEAVFYIVSTSENRGINRDGHIKGDHLC